MAQSDKYLADANKRRLAGQPYKARHSNTEPTLALTPLNFGGIATVLDLFFMDSKRKKIAIVDDDAGVRQSLERLLHLVGYSVRTFDSTPEFFEAIAKESVDCVVVDINLGANSGLEIADHPSVSGGKIPLIFISGAVEDRIRSRATAAGCIAVLSKPFKPAELLDAIFRATQDPLPIP
jgi:CheY-like chemotaxis protein